MAQMRTGVSIEERIARVRETYDALASDNLQAARPNFAEDAVFHSQLRQSDFRGRDAVFAEMERQQRERKLQTKVHDVCGSGEHAVALLEMSSETNGERRTDRVVHVLHLDNDGRIRELWALFNPND
jgi:ketosteroid isomerase-like protein